jgi:hypothetical protein
MPFFELTNARDMLNKAHREHERLTKDFNIDNLFNFFVTAYHIRDYVRRSGVQQKVLDEFMSDSDLNNCRDLCNQGKHLILTNRPDPSTQIYSGCFGGAPIASMPFSGGAKWVLTSESGEVDVPDLAKRVLEKWDQFFEKHQL